MRIDVRCILFLVMSLIWGGAWTAMKAGVAAVPPVLFAGTRFFVAGLLLLIISGLLRRDRSLHRADVARLLAVTVFMVAVPYALLFWGLLFVGSGLAAVLNLPVIPVTLLAASVAMKEEALTLRSALALGFGALGTAVVFFPHGLVPHEAGSQSNLQQLFGTLSIVASAVAYSYGSMLSRPLLMVYEPWLISGISMTTGGLALTLGSLAFESGAFGALSFHWGRAAWCGWFFLVFMGSIVATTVYLYLIRCWAPWQAGAYAFVSPVFAVLLGVIVFGESMSWLDGFGMSLMIAGAYLALARRPRSAKPEQASPKSYR